MTKRKRVAWLALAMALAVIGCTAMAASSASAGTYYWCVAKKKGEYTGSTCATKAKPKKGKFELEPITSCIATKKGEYANASCTTLAKPKKGKYEKVSGPHFSVSTGEAVLTTPDLGSGAVRCKASTAEGEIAGPKTSVERVTFSGCEFEGLPCESAGENSTPSGTSGVIITNLLDGKLIDHGEKGPSGGEPAVGEVWQELQSSEHEPYQAEFNCAWVVFLRTQGTISGAYTPASLNNLSTSAELLFEQGKGEQDLGTEALAESGWVGPFPSNEQIEGGVTVTTSPAVVVCGAPVEIRSGAKRNAANGDGCSKKAQFVLLPGVAPPRTFKGNNAVGGTTFPDSFMFYKKAGGEELSSISCPSVAYEGTMTRAASKVVGLKASYSNCVWEEGTANRKEVEVTSTCEDEVSIQEAKAGTASGELDLGPAACEIKFANFKDAEAQTKGCQLSVKALSESGGVQVKNLAGATGPTAMSLVATALKARYATNKKCPKAFEDSTVAGILLFFTEKTGAEGGVVMEEYEEGVA